MGQGKEEPGEGGFVKYHKSVLLHEVISFLDPAPGKRYIDATLGGGGHSRELLEAGAFVLGIDRDPDAISYVGQSFPKELLKNLTLFRGNFSDIGEIAKKTDFGEVDGIIFDLGVSSHQLEEANRGFSFGKEGPLDMRMDPGLSLTAKDIVNNFDKRRLNEIFQTYGQEKFAGPIAAAICSAREIKPIETTGQLREIVEKTIGRCRRGKRYERNRINPATKTFQALRIVVNSELLNLQQCLPQTVDLISTGGRLVIISFHSLEDAIVKRFFKGEDRLRSLTERPIGSSDSENEMNPRARSAKLRAAEKR